MEEKKLLYQRLLFHLDQEMHDLLVAEKERTGASLSEIIRRAIRKYLSDKGKTT